MFRTAKLDRERQVGNIVVDALCIETLAVGLAPPAEVERGDREAGRSEGLARPDVLAAMRIDAVSDDEAGPRRAVGFPVAREDAAP